MELLSQFLNRTAASNIFNYYPLCGKLSLTHLCFVDDLLAFMEASTNSFIRNKSITDDFHMLSGQRVNFNKSEVYFSGVDTSLHT